MSIESRPLWRDYSANQDNPDTPAIVNVKVAVENGVVGIITRAGSSWTYEDPTFRYIYDRAGELKIYRSSYWNFSPGADVDNQLSKWFSVHPVIDIVPRFAAVEINWNSLAPYQIAAEFYNFSETYLQREGERPGIYTRKQLADLWLTPFLDADWLNEHWWWLAQYDDYRHTEQDKPIIPPNKVDLSRCWLKQTADQMTGFPGEAESVHVDRDRFPFGTIPQMHEWIKTNFGGDITNSVDDCCEGLEKKFADAINLNTNELINFDNLMFEIGKKTGVNTVKIGELDKDLEIVEGIFNTRFSNNEKEIEKHQSALEKQYEIDVRFDAAVGNLEDRQLELVENIIKAEKRLDGLFDIHHTLNDYVFDEVFPKLKELESEQKMETRARKELDTAVYNNMNTLENDINQRIDGLEGGHDHPKWLKWLGLVK